MTQYLVRYLQKHVAAGSLETVLELAGETRHPEVLCDEPTWSTYDQFRNLLEATATVLGGPSELFTASASAWETVATREISGVVQALGSPGALYADIGLTAAGLSTIILAEGEEAGATEWTLTCRFKEGFEPFSEFCWFVAGLFAMSPRMFGFPQAEVTEEACQCAGAPACRFRVRWEAVDEGMRRAEYFETRAQILEARLEALQRTVTDLVSIDSLEGVLSMIVASAARAVLAPSFILAIEAIPSAAQQVYANGLDDAEATLLAGELLLHSPRSDSDRLVVEVRSARRLYGRLAAIRPDSGKFYPQELHILDAYGRLAAAALDSATALEEARHQAATARVLLELSTSLAEIVSTDDMANRVARAVPVVVDCDRSVVVLVDADRAEARIAGLWGYPIDVEARLRARHFPAPAISESFLALHSDGPGTATVVETEIAGDDERLKGILPDTGTIAFTTVPIMSNAGLIGWMTASVTERPERLLADNLPERLRGLASQAAIAITNARLLDQIRHQALHDPLTGLPNRALILDRVEQMLTRARRQRIPAAALFVDLDGFKDVNDTLGHGAGDQLLQVVAARLATTLRESDTIGRLGGDEFVVLVEGASLDAGPELIAERLLELLREPFELEGGRGGAMAITASIGIAVGDRDTPGELLRDADIALYAAKAAGKNRYVTFHPEMQTALRDRLDLAMDLRGALPAGEFFLVYQPMFNLQTTEVTGTEALLRWRHPARGVVQPDAFIPMLEDSGLIVDVGRWVLDEACRQTAAWNAQGHVLAISVNVSARQLETDRFIEDVAHALTTSELDPASLTIEITETTIMRDAEATARRLKAIKALGVRVAIDDFGTGYSSLAYLSQFPVDSLKIDRTFINAIAATPEAGALIHTLIQLGKSLGLETVAEGIEEGAQFRHLQDQRCDSGQGFLFARPLDPGALEEFLSTHTATHTATQTTTRTARLAAAPSVR